MNPYSYPYTDGSRCVTDMPFYVVFSDMSGYRAKKAGIALQIQKKLEQVSLI